MTEHLEDDPYATSWAKQVQDGVSSLKEFSGISRRLENSVQASR